MPRLCFFVLTLAMCVFTAPALASRISWPESPVEWIIDSTDGDSFVVRQKSELFAAPNEYLFTRNGPIEFPNQAKFGSWDQRSDRLFVPSNPVHVVKTHNRLYVLFKSGFSVALPKPFDRGKGFEMRLHDSEEVAFFSYVPAGEYSKTTCMVTPRGYFVLPSYWNIDELFVTVDGDVMRNNRDVSRDLKLTEARIYGPTLSEIKPALYEQELAAIRLQLEQEKAKRESASGKTGGPRGNTRSARVAEQNGGGDAAPSGLARLRHSRSEQVGLESELNKYVFGQDQLTKALASRVNRLKSRNLAKPEVVVITGPSGTGKSYVSRMAAELGLGDGGHFIEIDGTAFMDDGVGATHKLLGAESAYIGDQTGILSEGLREALAKKKKPILLINEGDKMDTKHWKSMMELMDYGKITPGDGATIEVNGLLIVITTNRGAKRMFPDSVKEWTEGDIQKRLQNLDADAVKSLYMSRDGANDEKILPPEVVNRVDDWLVAAPLTKRSVGQIAQKAVDSENELSLDDFGLRVKFTKNAVEHLGATGFASTRDGRWINRQVKNYHARILDAVADSDWTGEELEEIEVDIKHDKKAGPQFIISARGEKPLKVQAPEERSVHAFKDPTLVEKLRGLLSSLKRRVIGQDEALTSVAQIVTAHLANSERTRPSSFFLIGSTGTGKTETPRAIAEAIWGSASRASIIPLGNVMDMSDFNAIFGSQPGYVGSDITRLFEEALKAIPDGGVIVMDEASNMGGGNPEIKKAMFKTLYNMLEEGKWTSSVDGTEYDLKKYIFVFTGNDGEEAMQDITSDDQRMEVWKNNSKKSFLSKLLRNAGVPEAFLGRLADIILMKPLLSAEIPQITAKLVDQAVKTAEKQYPGLDVDLGEGFHQAMSSAFFTHDKGARSIRDILDYRLAALLPQALLGSGINLDNFSGVKAELSLMNNSRIKPYLTSRSPDQKVGLKVVIKKNGKFIHQETMDLTEFTTRQVLMPGERAKRTAFHEVGHALVNKESITGQRSTFETRHDPRWRPQGCRRK